MNKVSAILSTFTLAALIVVSVLAWKLQAGIEQLDARIDRQTLVLDDELGRQSSIKLIPRLDADLRSIEGEVLTAIGSKFDQAAVKRLDERMTALLDRLPPWARDEFQPRLMPRRWDINSMWLIVDLPPDEEDRLANHISMLEAQIASMPKGASDALLKNLEAQKAEEEKKQAKAELDFALRQADTAIQEGRGLDAALDLVSSYDDQAAKSRATRLQQLLQGQAIAKAVDNLEVELQRALALNGSSDRALRTSVAERISQAAMDLRWQAISVGLANPELAGRLEKLRTSAAAAIGDTSQGVPTAIAETRQQYQVWALGELKKIRNYEDIKNQQLAKVQSTFDRNNPLSVAYVKAQKDASATLRDEMIKFMAPIDQGLLDVAVSQWLQTIYMDRLNALAKDDQARAVEGFAKTIKKSLGGVP